MRIVIVDDEAPARDRLRQLVEDDSDNEVVGEAANGKAALEIISNTKPDVVLLDIRMPGLSGIEVAHHLSSLDEPPAVVFTTAYDEYAIEAFEANAIGYVLKPVRRERLGKAMRQAARISHGSMHQIAGTPGLDATRNHICARVQNQLKLIPIEEVRYFHADQKYVRVHHGSGDNLIDDSLKSLEEEFTDILVRIHRSVLVAISHIDSLQKTSDGQMQIVLRDAADNANSLIISRRHLADVKRRLKGA
jgi:two-component system response regulator AlgR